MSIKIRLKVKFNLKRGFLISGFGWFTCCGQLCALGEVLHSHETRQNLMVRGEGVG